MLIESSRIGVFRALIDRVAALHAQEESVLDVRVSFTQLTSISETSFIILSAVHFSRVRDFKRRRPETSRALHSKATTHSGMSLATHFRS